jgi:hypothetical protein
VHDEHHDEEDAPCGKGADATRDKTLVQEEANREGADDLREPVYEVVQRSRTDVEQRLVVFIEFCSKSKYLVSASVVPQNNRMCDKK